MNPPNYEWSPPDAQAEDPQSPSLDLGTENTSKGSQSVTSLIISEMFETKTNNKTKLLQKSMKTLPTYG